MLKNEPPARDRLGDKNGGEVLGQDTEPGGSHLAQRRKSTGIRSASRVLYPTSAEVGSNRRGDFSLAPRSTVS